MNQSNAEYVLEEDSIDVQMQQIKAKIKTLQQDLVTAAMNPSDSGLNQSELLLAIREEREKIKNLRG